MTHAHHVLIRWPMRLFQAVAWLVIVSITVNTITPGVLGAKTLIEQSSASGARSELEIATASLATIEEILDRMDRRAHGKFEFPWQETAARMSRQVSPAAATRAQLVALQTALDQAVSKLDELQPAVQQSFTDDAAQLRNANLDARVQAQKSQYDQLYAQFRALLGKIAQARTDAAYKQAVADARGFLATHSSKPRHAAFDPSHLAFGASRARAREALTDPAALQAAINAPIDVNGKGKRAIGVNVAAGAKSTADVAPDLAPTEDVQITDAIRAKAAELHGNPLEIYQWVRNNVEYVPTYGSIQGSAQTLLTLRGNDFDQASLLIALLRASNVHSRYVYGTVVAPIAKVQNWIGGVGAPNIALDLMGSAGIPVTGLAQGGVIQQARFEHVWVEALLDYVPSRGAKNAEGDTWLPLDPSFKQYAYSAPLDIPGIAAMDAATDLAGVMASASTGNGGASVTGLNADFAASRISLYQQRLGDYATAQGSPLTLAQGFGSRTIVTEALPYLPATLPFTSVTAGSRLAALPAQLRHSITIELYDSVQDQAMESPSLTKTISLPSIGERRLGITYAPATASDAAVLQGLTGNNVPLYAVRVKPQIKLDDVLVSEGGALGMGQDQPLALTLRGPAGSRHSTHARIAGDEMVVGIDAMGVSQDQIERRFAAVTPDSAAENLHQLSLLYWTESDMLGRFAQGRYATFSTRMPSAGIFSSPLEVVYSFGIPNRGYYIKRNIDIGMSFHAVAGGDHRRVVDYVGFIGTMGSYLEGAAQEQLFHYWQGSGNSTIQSFIDANSQHIPIYSITQANSAALLGNLQIPGEAMSDISNALAAGYEVIVPERAATKASGATGIGYELRDPQTGSAAYLIRGGTNGGDSQAPCAEPERVPVSQWVYIIIATLIILAILAAMWYGSGGTAAPLTEPVAAALMAAFGLTALAFPATAGAMNCNPVPVPHKGNNAIHDQCADTRVPNMYVGSDVCVTAPIAGSKNFDAYGGGILWEVKTYNFNNTTDPTFLVTLDKPEWIKESAIARECGMQFWYTVGDPRHVAALNLVQPGFVPVIANNIELDPANCLQP